MILKYHAATYPVSVIISEACSSDVETVDVELPAPSLCCKDYEHSSDYH